MAAFEQVREITPNFSVVRPSSNNRSHNEVRQLEIQLGNMRGAPPINLTPLGGTQTAAYRAARRSLNIPMGISPTSVIPNIGNSGVINPGRVEIFRIPNGQGGFRDRLIRHDVNGHYYGIGNIQNQGPHYNTGQFRNGKQANDGGHYGY